MANSSHGSEQFPALEPAVRADAAAKRLLVCLSSELEGRQADFLAGQGGESLHDFRVAVRRTRTLLGQLKHVFPAPRVRRYADGFAELGQLTTPCRDWEVYLQSFGALAQGLPPELYAALDPLRSMLADRHGQEQRRVVLHLSSPVHRLFLEQWRSFLAAPLPRSSRLRCAAQPVAAVAGRRIWKLYRRVVQQGEALGPESSPAEWHELRKSCKKLRYLMEFFYSLYPAGPHGKLIAILKALQDELGTSQDCHVQAQALLELGSTPRIKRAPPATLMAMGALVVRLERNAAKARAAFQRRFARLASAKVRERFAELYAPITG